MSLSDEFEEFESDYAEIVIKPSGNQFFPYYVGFKTDLPTELVNNHDALVSTLEDARLYSSSLLLRYRGIATTIQVVEELGCVLKR